MTNTAVAHASNDDIRAALRGEQVTDPSWQDADGKVTCEITLIMSTPVSPNSSPEDTIRNLEWHAEQSAHRIAAIRTLADNGWTMTAGMLIDHDGTPPEDLPDLRTIDALTPITGSFCDVQLVFRKRLVDERELRQEAANAQITGKENWGLGFNEVDGQCEWTDEA